MNLSVCSCRSLQGLPTIVLAPVSTFMDEPFTYMLQFLEEGPGDSTGPRVFTKTFART